MTNKVAMVDDALTAGLSQLQLEHGHCIGFTRPARVHGYHELDSGYCDPDPSAILRLPYLNAVLMTLGFAPLP